MVPMINPIFVALDLDSAPQALELARELKGLVGGFKVGPRLVVPHGAEFVRELAQCGPVFVDMKYLDIPNTMESAIRATFEAGATWATIHAWSGLHAMKRLSTVEAELNKRRPFQILAVTVLTSFSPETLPPYLKEIAIEDQVVSLARETSEAGLSGLVASAWELPALSTLPLFKVIPGIRMPHDPPDDQARTLTPKEALARGASALVIGRPIVNAVDPVKATETILASIS